MPGYVFRPQKDWLARMRQNNIDSHVGFTKVTLEEVIGELKDDWLVCKVYRTHIVNAPFLECPDCNALFCVRCNKNKRN